jgi:hypothetical protein
MTEQAKPKGKPRGRKGGRPKSLVPHKRINVYLSLLTIAILHSIHKSPSKAIEIMANKEQKK